MTNKKIVAYLDEMMREHRAQLKLLDVLEDREPHASLLLTNGRYQDALDLAHVLRKPMDLTKMELPKRVRQQAERVWKRFGRDIDIEIVMLPNGFINIHGDLRHASAYIGEIIP